METKEALEKIGLSDKQAAVYLALLELGTASVEPIAKKAGIKRPTTYLILDELQGLALVSKIPNVRKSLYQAESPDTLAGQIYRKGELLKRFLPELSAVYNARKDKPKVQLFEGKEGVAQVYDKIFSSPEILFFSTIREVFQLFPDMQKNAMELVLSGKLKMREILTQTPADIRYVSSMPEHPNYQSRLAPKDSSEFLTDSALYQNSVAFFSFSPRIFAVVITSHQIVESIKTLYELAWRAGKPYEHKRK